MKMINNSFCFGHISPTKKPLSGLGLNVFALANTVFGERLVTAQVRPEIASLFSGFEDCSIIEAVFFVTIFIEEHRKQLCGLKQSVTTTQPSFAFIASLFASTISSISFSKFILIPLFICFVVYERDIITMGISVNSYSKRIVLFLKNIPEHTDPLICLPFTPVASNPVE